MSITASFMLSFACFQLLPLWFADLRQPVCTVLRPSMFMLCRRGLSASETVAGNKTSLWKIETDLENRFFIDPLHAALVEIARKDLQGQILEFSLTEAIYPDSLQQLERDPKADFISIQTSSTTFPFWRFPNIGQLQIQYKVPHASTHAVVMVSNFEIHDI